MLRTFVSTIAFLLTAETIVLAQLPPQPPPVANPFGQATEQERAACHPDVIKHCRELVKDDAQSDVFAILGCLQTNRLKAQHRLPPSARQSRRVTEASRPLEIGN